MVIRPIKKEYFKGITEEAKLKPISFGLSDQDKYDLMPEYDEFLGSIHINSNGDYVVSIDAISKAGRESLVTGLDHRSPKEEELIIRALEYDFEIPRDAYEKMYAGKVIHTY